MTRLLTLGYNNEPSLFVRVEREYSPTHFVFWVLNGNWKGTYTNGYITVHGAVGGDWSSLDKFEILADNEEMSVPLDVNSTPF
jgi:hypothetical protein